MKNTAGRAHSVPVLLTKTEPWSQRIPAENNPILIHVRQLCDNESVVLNYITGPGTECNPARGSVPVICGNRYFANMENNIIITPFPGVFSLKYTGKTQVEFVTFALPYEYSFDMIQPLCCNQQPVDLV